MFKIKKNRIPFTEDTNDAYLKTLSKLRRLMIKIEGFEKVWIQFTYFEFSLRILRLIASVELQIEAIV